MRYWTWVWVALACGCAELEEVPEAEVPKGPAVDALVSGRVDVGWQPATDLARPDAALPQDVGPPLDEGPGFTPDAGCRPNTRLGQCAICSPQGVPEVPVDDGTCPDFDCGQPVEYQRRQDGAVDVCVLVERGGDGNHCQALGQCHTQAEAFCGAPVETEVARADGPCQAFDGCQGLAAPQPVAMVGAPCNGVGECQADGTCSAPAGCERFADARTLCDAGTENGQAYCDLFIQVGRTDCNTYCQRWGAVCLQAWGERDDTCERSGGRGCGDDADDQICRCSLP